MLGRDVLYDRKIRKAAAGHYYSGQEEGGRGSGGVFSMFSRGGEGYCHLNMTYDEAKNHHEMKGKLLRNKIQFLFSVILRGKWVKRV